MNSIPLLPTAILPFGATGSEWIRELAIVEQDSDFGFRPTNKKNKSAGIAYKLSPDDIASVEVFAHYGFMPELIGRFGSIAHLSPLAKKDLMKILKKNVLPKYKEEFQREGQKLTVPKKIMEEIVKKAMERQTGARGISLLLTEYFEKQAFECFGQDSEDIPF